MSSTTAPGTELLLASARALAAQRSSVDEHLAGVGAVGARRIYSNTGFEVLAAHVEESTGYDFPEWMEQTVVQGLDLVDLEVDEDSPTGAPLLDRGQTALRSGGGSGVTHVVTVATAPVAPPGSMVRWLG